MLVERTRRLPWQTAPPAVQAAISVGLGLVPDSGDLEGLVGAVAARRGRTLRLQPYPLGIDQPSGLWIMTARGDCIVYDSHASTQQAEAIVCHELAHMLLNHEPAATKSAEFSKVAEIVLDPKVAARFLTRHGYTEEAEAAAESVATYLLAELAAHASAHALTRDNISARLR